MAVWIFAYGRNGLLLDPLINPEKYLSLLNAIPLNEIKILDSIKETGAPRLTSRKYYTENRASVKKYLLTNSKEKYLEYLTSLKLPFMEIDELINYFIEDGESKELNRIEAFNFTYDQYKAGSLKAKWETGGERGLLNHSDYYKNTLGMQLSLINDLIWITGPSEIFSVYSGFINTISADSREYYHSYFKEIFKALKSDFILYAHEWSGLDDEEDKEFNLAKLIDQSGLEKYSSDSIHTMKSFYYEKIISGDF